MGECLKAASGPGLGKGHMLGATAGTHYIFTMGHTDASVGDFVDAALVKAGVVQNGEP